MSIYKKRWKEDLGNYRPVSLTLVPGKVMEQIILCVIMQHTQDNQGIRPTQHWFVKDSFGVNIPSFGGLSMTLIHCTMNDIRVTERQSDPEKLKTTSSFAVASHGTKLNGKERFKGCQSNRGMDNIIYCNRESYAFTVVVSHSSDLRALRRQKQLGSHQWDEATFFPVWYLRKSAQIPGLQAAMLHPAVPVPGKRQKCAGKLRSHNVDFLAKYCIFSQEKLAKHKRAFEAFPQILEIVDYYVTDGLTDLRLFAVMASLAQKIAALE
ncbi:hypothetical protein BTVI_131999 [Pitangus sulphuratus]|nr:hypothetical protein BTVI_131999 [Pitangus sulphuratus]